MCAEMLMRSIPSPEASSAVLPAAWTASVWKSAPYLCARSAHSRTGIRTPVSLLAAMTDTTATVSSMAFSRLSRSSSPSPVTPARRRVQPSLSSCLAVSRTAGCSTCVVTIVLRPERAGAPRSAQLSLSVPPLVNTTEGVSPLPGAAPISFATAPLASSTASMSELPKVWKLEGLPNRSPRKGSIAARTRGSREVVALLSR